MRCWSRAISISHSSCRPAWHPVVASCGTALTSSQAQLLRRFTSKVILSFDPDAAGQGAAARSCELLVAEGFEVNVAVLPTGEDPDSFVQKRGRDAYLDLLKASRPYLEYLLDRSAAAHDLTNDEGQASVPDVDAGRRRAYSGPGRPGPVWRSPGAQGADYRRGGESGGSQGGRAEATRP